ncbi:MAG: hypothetical protein D6688_02785, partial [Alphaproteobacteria bacterium]
EGVWRIDLPEGQLNDLVVALIGLSDCERAIALAHLPENASVRELAPDALCGVTPPVLTPVLTPVLADVVVAPVIGAPLDAFDLCGLLSRAAFSGRILFVGKGVADIAMIERELRAAHPGLCIQVIGAAVRT